MPIDLTKRRSPLSTTELADACGLSAQTIRNEIALGELYAARKRGPAGRVRYLIPWEDAVAYAVQIGILRVDVKTN